MKALTLTQLWASLCIWTDNEGNAEKQFETRSWKTSYRGVIAIHAAKGFPKYAKDLAQTNPFFREAMSQHRVDFVEQLPFGEILGTVELVEIYRTDAVFPKSAKELAFGDYSSNRYAWRFINPKELKTPIPCKGALSLWEVPKEIEAQILEQII